MRPLLHRRAVSHDNNLVRVLDRGQPMCDDDNGHVPSRNHVIYCCLHHSFRSGVQRGCSFVEKQNLRFSNEGACNCYALLLSSAQLSASFPDLRIVLLRKSHDEVMCIGELRCFFDLLHGGAVCIVQTVTDILLDRAGEEYRFLPNQRDISVKPLGVEVGDGHGIEQHGALIRLIEALEKCNGGGLARAARPAQRNHLSRTHIHTEVSQHLLLLSGRITELNSLHLHLSLALLRRDGVGWRLDLRLTIYPLKHLISCAKGLDEAGVDTPKAIEGCEETLHVEHERYELPRIYLVLAAELSPVEEDKACRRIWQKRERQCRVKRIRQGHFLCFLVKVLHLSGVAHGLLPLGGEGLDSTNGRNALIRHGVCIRYSLLDSLR
mmetsp:Transcript_23226/g.37388  ORF Transcript_23226/g.37388 Transcript_23226/m.37388 type:complete len:379 (-) Transcript_23226:295-1431(-)